MENLKLYLSSLSTIHLVWATVCGAARRITSKEVSFMTQNRIDYYKAVTERRNLRNQLALSHRIADETNRHNVATEQEVGRHNQATEREEARRSAINAGNLAETNRANLQKEAQQDRIISETNRANLSRELETHRANVAAESLGYQNALIASRNASTNALNAETNSYNATTQANRMVLESRSVESENALRKQQQLESQARAKYYNTQSEMVGPSNAISNVFKTLKSAADIAVLFQ